MAKKIMMMRISKELLLRSIIFPLPLFFHLLLFPLFSSQTTAFSSHSFLKTSLLLLFSLSISPSRLPSAIVFPLASLSPFPFPHHRFFCSNFPLLLFSLLFTHFYHILFFPTKKQTATLSLQSVLSSICF